MQHGVDVRRVSTISQDLASEAAAEARAWRQVSGVAGLSLSDETSEFLVSHQPCPAFIPRRNI